MFKSILLSFSFCFAVFIANAQYTKADLYSDLQTLLDNKQSQYGLEGASISVLLKDGSSWTGVSGNRLPNTQLDPNLQ